MLKFKFKNLKNGDIIIITAKTLQTAGRLYETRYPDDVKDTVLIEVQEKIIIKSDFDINLELSKN